VLENDEGDLTHHGPEYSVSQSFFVETILPSLHQNDSVILLHSAQHPCPYLFELPNEIKKRSSAEVILISFETGASKSESEIPLTSIDKIVRIPLPFYDALPGLPVFLEISAKWILNAISTGGFTLQGKVFQNRMIDLGITNNKLFQRAIGIVAKFGNVSEPEARQNLLRAIYQIEKSEVPREIDEAPISNHLRKVSEEAKKGFTKMVALAILLCTRSLTVATAKQILSVEPVVRNILLGKQRNR